MGVRDLPDMYVCLKPKSHRSKSEGTHVRQIMSVHVISNMYHFRHSKVCLNVRFVALPTYLGNRDYDIFIMLLP